MRLDAYIAKKRPEHSRATWVKYIKDGFITVDGKKANGSDIVSDDNKIEINLPELTVKKIDLPIIYEDDDVIVINKPAGVLTHSKGAVNDEFTVADFIQNKARQSDLPKSNRFGIVHRLDRGTSGVIIGAKNEESLKKLQKQFSDRKAKKTYLALVEKAPKNKEFVIDLPIARNPKHPSQFRVDAKGKPATTEAKVLKTFGSGRALLELKPRTGRTHQLRIHLSYIGSPIVGDSVYGNAKHKDRMMLHAKELEITLLGGERKVFTAEVPKGFYV